MIAKKATIRHKAPAAGVQRHCPACPFCGEAPEVKQWTHNADKWHSRSCEARVSCRTPTCHVSPELHIAGYDSEEVALQIALERWAHRPNVSDQTQRAKD